jgi:hypothetical protein
MPVPFRSCRDRTGQCFDEGYVDGRDNPFSRDMYDEYGGSSGGPETMNTITGL